MRGSAALRRVAPDSVTRARDDDTHARTHTPIGFRHIVFGIIIIIIFYSVYKVNHGR